MRDENLTDGVSSFCLMSAGVPVLLTGTLVETVMAEILLPGKCFTPGTMVRLTTMWQCTNNANNKIFRARLTNVSGPGLLTDMRTTIASAAFQTMFFCRRVFSARTSVVVVSISAPFAKVERKVVRCRSMFKVQRPLTDKETRTSIRSARVRCRSFAEVRAGRAPLHPRQGIER